jgi:hypothetical protein
MTGAAWSNLKSDADKSAGTPDLSNQDDPTNVIILAKAIVFARTRSESYRTDVRAALNSIIYSGTYTGRALALGRELISYVIAADLINLRNYNAQMDIQFREKIKELRTTYTNSGPSSIIECHNERPNNWGAHCGATRIAIDLYINDQTDLLNALKVFRGYLGDRTQYAGFNFGSDLTWHCDSSRPVPINPKGCIKQGLNIDGVMPDDQRRGGSFVTTNIPNENYAYEALQGLLAQAIMLKRQGYDVFNFSDQALLRAFAWLNNVNEFVAAGDDTWEPYVVNYFYGSNFYHTTSTNPGKNVGYTDFTLQK